MSYLVVAYPKLAKKDFEKIQNYRKHNNQLYFNLVDPHFTLVFPVSGISEIEFVSEIKTRCTDLTSIDFCIRCATISKDSFNENYHAFLVPDQGYSQIVKAHDKLYSGKLKDNLRLDIDFVPHIGVGNSKDKFACKKMVDKWNSEEFSINGSITHLTIVTYKNDLVTKIEEIEL